LDLSGSATVDAPRRPEVVTHGIDRLLRGMAFIIADEAPTFDSVDYAAVTLHNQHMRTSLPPKSAG